MAEKCKVCGYKFKRGDGSLCPECFTARTDEMNFAPEGFRASNIFGRNRNEEKLGSFLADEMREELHEDISMKKSLDREDAEKTRSFTAQGANVKNETFKEAFQERKNRDRSNPGRVYTKTETNNSIDPALRDKIYGTKPNESTFRYSSHNSGSTSNQQMLYGINGGRAPGGNQTAAYNFTSKNQQKYSKGSSSKAAAVVIISIAIFSTLVGIISSVDEENENSESKKSYSGINSVDISIPDVSIPDIDISIPDFDFDYDDPYDYILYGDYGDYTLYLLDYSDGQTVKNALTDPETKKLVYPVEGENMSTDEYRELVLTFYVDGEENEIEEIPELENMILTSQNNGNDMCISYSFDVNEDYTNLQSDQYVITAKFIVPITATGFGLDIYYKTEEEPDGYTYIDKFSRRVLDAWNGRTENGSSDAS